MSDEIGAGLITPSGATVADALRFGQRRLAVSGVETPRLDAEVLLRHVLRLEGAALMARLHEPVAAAALAVFASLLERRAGGVPVSYLTGEREFMGLPFAVRPGVLVPRPETEILVEWALGWLRGRGAASVVDVGTGSGAIALGLAAHLGPSWPGRIIASDVSPLALEVAAENRQRIELVERVELVQGSLIDWLTEPVDLLLANLPYLRPEQIAANPDLAAEPCLALDGGAAGLDLIAALLRDAPRVLRSGGAAGLEIDPGQAETVIALARVAFPAAEIGILPDLAGRDRHVTIVTPPNEEAG